MSSRTKKKPMPKNDDDDNDNDKIQNNSFLSSSSPTILCIEMRSCRQDLYSSTAATGCSSLSNMVCMDILIQQVVVEM